MRRLMLLVLAVVAAVVLLLVSAASPVGLGNGRWSDSRGFGTGGKVLLSDDFNPVSAAPVVLQPDGGIVVQFEGRLIRYTTSGRPDPSFGHRGTVLMTDTTSSLAVEPDGRIVAVGTKVRPEGKPGDFTDIALARYTRNGRLDPSFGKGGKVVLDISDHDSAGGVAIQHDGGIVVACWILQYMPSTSRIGFVRYTRDGRLDAGFGNGGMMLAERGKDGAVSAGALAIEPDGKIVAAGFSGEPGSEQFALARYTADGSLDKGFGSGGRVALKHVGTSANAIAIQSDGKIIAVGSIYGKSERFTLVRLTSHGELDKSFGSGGKVVTSFGPHIDGAAANAVAIQPDGKIVAAGESPAGDDKYQFALARYTTAGTLDPRFGTNGKVLTRMAPTFMGGAESVVIQPDGKIVAAGYGGLARYTPDGRLDSG